jgi:hypothetical protein
VTLTAESFPGRVLAVFSRRSPAFRPPKRKPRADVTGSETARSHAGVTGPRSTSIGGPQIQQRQWSVEARKAAFYRWQVERQGARSWATHLAQHPGDAELAIKALTRQNLETLRAHMNEVLAALERTESDTWETEHARSLALATVRRILAEREGNVGQAHIKIIWVEGHVPADLPLEEPSYPGT